MKVSSPIGDLPFEPSALHVRSTGVEIEGAMGAWPARVVIGPGDIPSLLRLVRGPGLAAAALTALILAIRRSRRPAD